MVTTSLLEDITHKVAALPVELQREALDFIEFIAQRAKKGATSEAVADDTSALSLPTKSMFGLLAGTTTDITLEEIKELRREMWQNFPREFPE
jgi:hypothetical protein